MTLKANGKLGSSAFRAFKPERLPALRPVKCFVDQALWPQAFVVRAFKLAICLQSHLFLGRSSLPFASPQTRKMVCGRFDQAPWPQAFVVRAFKLAIYLQNHLQRSSESSVFRRSSLPFASPQTRKMLRGSFDQALWSQAFLVIRCY